MKRSLAILTLAGLSQAALATAPAEKSPADGGQVTTVADAAAEPAKQPSLEDRRRAAEKFGECIATNRLLHRKAIAFLLSGKARDGKALADEACYNEALAAGMTDPDSRRRPTVLALRSLVADGLVRVDFRKQGPSEFSGVPPLAIDDTDADDATTPALAKAKAIAYQLGECTARVSPESVRQLAQTDAASAEEMSKVRELVPTFAQCLPPGVELAFPVNVLRDSSVLAYARLAFTRGRKDGR